VESDCGLVDVDVQIQFWQLELEGATVRFVGHRFGQFGNILQYVDLILDPYRTGEFDDQMVAVVGEAIVEAGISRDLLRVKSHDLGSQ